MQRCKWAPHVDSSSFVKAGTLIRITLSLTLAMYARSCLTAAISTPALPLKVTRLQFKQYAAIAWSTASEYLCCATHKGRSRQGPLIVTMHTYIQMYIHTYYIRTHYICIYIHTHTYINTYTRAYIHMYIHTCIHAYIQYVTPHCNTHYLVK